MTSEKPTLIPLCHVDSLPCAKEVQSGDPARCRYYWNETVIAKCLERYPDRYACKGKKQNVPEGPVEK